MAQAVREIRVKAVAEGDGLKIISAQMQRLSKDVRSVRDNSQSLANVLPTIFTGMGIMGIARIADEFQLMSDRMKVFAKDGEDTSKMFSNLVSAANATKTSVQSLGTVYNRLTVAMSGIGATSDQVLATTVALQQTFRLSGATMAEATGAAIQLSQGLSSGQLRGQELRSVLEANGVMAQILAKHFQISTGQLIKFAEAGKITSKEVLSAMAENFDELNKKAGGLRQTFEQTLTVAMNNLGVMVNRLNQQWGIGSKFAQGMEYMLKNIYLVNIALTTLASVGIAKVIQSIYTLTAALLGSGWGAIIVGVGVAIGLFLNWDAAINGVMRGLNRLAYYLILVIQKLDEMSNYRFSGMVQAFNDMAEAVKKVKEFLDWGSELEKNRQALENINKVNGSEGLEQTGSTFDKVMGKLQSFREWMSNPFGIKEVGEEAKAAAPKISIFGETINKLEAQMKQLNSEHKKMENKNFSSGFDTKKLADSLKDLSNIKENITVVDTFKKRMADLAEQLRTGQINWVQYDSAMRAVEIDELNDKVQKGTINLVEYHQKLVKISDELNSGTFAAGVDAYLKSSGTLAQNIAQGITATFGRLEDALFDFIKKGTFEFHKFTQAILDDLLRIVIRASIVRPLANALLGSFTGGAASPGAGAGGAGASDLSTGQSATYAAHGHAFAGGQLQMFAKGGLVNAPTMFTFANGGKVGMAGEAGTEGILPLKRNRSGDLGVNAVGLGGSGGSNVVVNVINNSSDSETQTKESTDQNGNRVIDVLIIQKVKEGLTKGSFDKDMQRVYGLQRKGN